MNTVTSPARGSPRPHPVCASEDVSGAPGAAGVTGAAGQEPAARAGARGELAGIPADEVTNRSDLVRVAECRPRLGHVAMEDSSPIPRGGYTLGPRSWRRDLALKTIRHEPDGRVPSWFIHVMDHEQIERLAGVEEGAYRRSPEATYIAFQRGVGTCLLDQFIPQNPLTMGSRGLVGRNRGPTTGADELILDGVRIDSPEAVVEHLEGSVFPGLERAAGDLDARKRVREILEGEGRIQEKLGPEILKGGYGFVSFPHLAYGTYGYENYFMAYALYPEVMERHFSLQGDLARLNNEAAAAAYREGGLPPLHRLDHDMADSRGTLVDIRSLEAIWFPHLARSLEPLLAADVRLIWHCDGNLMEMVPRLLEVGIGGFQGFQYEDGMDYGAICGMRTRDGGPLTIIGGVSVTTTLPNGTPDDVRRELKWLVERGPETGLFLGASSTITPGVPWENVKALVEGLKHYQRHGRGG